MSATQFESFYKHYVKAIHEGNAAVFVGAGLSRACGYVDWRVLLKDIAEDRGLDIDQETDLIALAQFHQTKHLNRAKLDRLIIEEFTRHTEISENHRLLANLPIDTVWTTNYDKLIENAFEQAHRLVDVKRTPENLQHPVPGRGVTVYKMHGDVDYPQDAVLTKEDYETYDSSRELFSIKLKGDLVGKTFLFLGFSFTDPNIDYILSRIRALLGKDKGQHYAVMRWPSKPVREGFKSSKAFREAEEHYAYDRKRLDLRSGDLRRYGIEALMIDEYSEITTILSELNRRVHLRNVFVSGSAHSFDPMGEPRIDELCRLLGKRLINEGLNLVSGVGLGIGGKVVIGALESLYRKHYDESHDRLFLRPFPQQPPSGVSLKDFWTKYRTDMLLKAGTCVYISGNKLDDATGTIVEAGGVIEEFEIATKLGKFPIPIGATGHTARRLWEKVNASLDTYYPNVNIEDYLKVLGKDSSTNEQLVGAVIGILGLLKAV